MRWPKWPDTLVVGFFCAVALLFAAPILTDLGNWGILDWDFQLHHHAVPRASIVSHGELPLWNPYNRSGVPMLAHPESRVLAPGFLLSLAFGELIGLKLEILLQLVLGMLGTSLLLRQYGASRGAALAGGVAFMLNSSYALHLCVGHVWALSFAYLPWILLCYRKALRNRRYSLAASGMLVLTIFSGAPYQFMIAWALLGAYAAFAVLIQREGLRRHALLIVAILLQVLALGAVKLLPTQELMSQYPRQTSSESGYTWSALGNALFDPDQTLAAARAERPEEFNATPLHEGMYVGFTAAALFALGLTALSRRKLVLLASLLLFVWISLGQHAPLDLWSLIHRLPGYDNMRLVQRFGVVVLLIGSLFVGFGVDRLRALARATNLGRRASTVAAGAAIALLVAELLAVNRPVLAEAFAIPPLELQQDSAFQQIGQLPYYDAQGWLEGPPRRVVGAPALTSLYPAVLSNRGSTVGYQIVPFASNALPAASPGYRGELHLEAADGAATSGSARYLAWSPNRMQVELRDPQHGVLVINQNYARGWQARSGRGEARAVDSRRGLIGVALLAEDQSIVLRYRPQSVVLGALVTLVAASALICWAAWPRLTRLSRAPRSDRRHPTAW